MTPKSKQECSNISSESIILEHFTQDNKNGQICAHFAFLKDKMPSASGVYAPWPSNHGLCSWILLEAPPPDPHYRLAFRARPYMSPPHLRGGLRLSSSSCVMYECPESFWVSLTTPMDTFLKLFWCAFVLIDCMNVHRKFEMRIALAVRILRLWRLEFWLGSWMVPFKRVLATSYRPSIVTFPLS